MDELKGKTLGLWCKPKQCHGDVLLELLAEQKQRQHPESSNKPKGVIVCEKCEKFPSSNAKF